MLSKNLTLKIFEAFSIERWNDLVRPFEFIEMDKAAEKMVEEYRKKVGDKKIESEEEPLVERDFEG